MGCPCSDLASVRRLIDDSRCHVRAQERVFGKKENESDLFIDLLLQELGRTTVMMASEKTSWKTADCFSRCMFSVIMHLLKSLA